jgi:hypothetical protein
MPFQAIERLSFFMKFSIDVFCRIYGVCVRPAVIAFLLLAFVGIAVQPAYSQQFAANDLVSSSYPPNELSDAVGSPTGNGLTLNATGAGDYAQFVVDIPAPGAYAVTIDLQNDSASGIFGLEINGDVVGQPVDLYSGDTTADVPVSFGNYYFLTAGHAFFRLYVRGENTASSGYGVTVQSITVTPTQMFTLAAPTGVYLAAGNPLLVWNAPAHARAYDVSIDGNHVARLPGAITSYQATGLAPGVHTWNVTAYGVNGVGAQSNTLSFHVGTAPVYPDRDNDNALDTAGVKHLIATSATVTPLPSAPGAAVDFDPAGGWAAIDDVRLGLTEGEVSADITVPHMGASAGVGFAADDGTRIAAILDPDRVQFRLERTTKAYSIFDTTPKLYVAAGWVERSTTSGDKIWEIKSAAMAFTPGVTYHVSLSYSRRSCCIMGIVSGGDLAAPIVLRDLTDTNIPDHPAIIGLGPGVKFGTLHFKHLNKGVYKWDIYSNRIVLRPGAAGSWDSKGAFNPAVVVKDGTWYMTYRGNDVPAPPDGPPASQIGAATSTDGVHWTKFTDNPIVSRVGDNDSVEDPDMVVPSGQSQFYLEYNHFGHMGEVLSSGDTLDHMSAPWPIPTVGFQSGKVSGIVDTENAQQIAPIRFNGITYRYVGLIEEGTIILSNDLHTWVNAGIADFTGKPTRWCSDHECGGDFFVDHDGNFRVETQAGTDGGIVGNRKCTIMEEVLSGTAPTKVISRSDLPFLPDWYGNAPTGDLNENTFTNGSVFPGQTVINGGYLWLYYGGNNTFTGLIKCVYGPEFDCSNLVASRVGTGANSVVQGTVDVRNDGSLSGAGQIPVIVDGKSAIVLTPTLQPDQSVTETFQFPVTADVHVVSVQQYAVAL